MVECESNFRPHPCQPQPHNKDPPSKERNTTSLPCWKTGQVLRVTKNPNRRIGEEKIQSDTKNHRSLQPKLRRQEILVEIPVLSPRDWSRAEVVF